MALPAWDAAPNMSSDSALEDSELVGRVQAGDVAAFSELFQRYNSRICTYLVRLTSDDELGHDLAQETFLKAFDALQSSRQEEILSFKSWLYRIATNLVNDHWRRTRLIRWVRWPWKEYRESNDNNSSNRTKSDKQEEEVEWGYLALPGPEEQIEEAELVQIALAQVSLKYRACLILEIVEEMPQREIAQLLNISERSVRRYIKRGYEELCEAYNRLADGEENA